MRGEKIIIYIIIHYIYGSPPLARGKVLEVTKILQKDGITPACAGKRLFLQGKLPVSGDHPRLRGEKEKWLIYL